MSTSRVLVVLALAAIPARAQVLDVDPDVEVARRHFQAGAALYDRGKYEPALGEFEAGQRLKPTPAFDYNIARCFDRLERYPEAIAAYQRYLDAAPRAADAPALRARLETLKLRVATPVPQTPPAVAAPTPAVATPAPLVATPLVATPEPSRRSLSARRKYIAPIAVGVSALVLGVTGAGLLGSVGPDYDSLYRTCRPCASNRVDALQARADAGYALLGVAGALAITDVVLFLVARRR